MKNSVIINFLERFLGLFCRITALSLFVSFLAASPLFADQCRLFWGCSSPPSPMGYKVYAGTARRSYSRIIDVGLATTTLVTDLRPYTTYFFAITAYYSTGESNFSNEGWLSWTPPSTPTNITADAVSDSRIRVRWNPEPGGAKIGGIFANANDMIGRTGILKLMEVAGYMVYRDKDLVATTTVSFYSDSGLDPDTRYCYVVKAFNQFKSTSGPAGPVCATTPSELTSTFETSFFSIPPNPTTPMGTSARNPVKGRETRFVVPIHTPQNFSGTNPSAPAIKPRWGTPFFFLPFRPFRYSRQVATDAVITDSWNNSSGKTPQSLSTEQASVQSRRVFGGTLNPGMGYTRRLPSVVPALRATPAGSGYSAAPVGFSAVITAMYATANSFFGESFRPDDFTPLPVISKESRPASHEAGAASKSRARNSDFSSTTFGAGSLPPKKSRTLTAESAGLQGNLQTPESSKPAHQKGNRDYADDSLRKTPESSKPAHQKGNRDYADDSLRKTPAALAAMAQFFNTTGRSTGEPGLSPGAPKRDNAESPILFFHNKLPASSALLFILFVGLLLYYFIGRNT